MLLSGGGQKTHGNEPNAFLLGFRQLRDVLLLKLDSGNDSMVVSDLCVVDDPFHIGIVPDAVENRHLPTDDVNDLTGSAFHVICDELTVGTGIGQEFLFIERLNEIKRLLRQ